MVSVSGVSISHSPRFTSKPHTSFYLPLYSDRSYFSTFLSLSLFVPFSLFIFQRSERRMYPDFESESSRGHAYVYRACVHVRRVQRVDQAKRIRRVYKGEYRQWRFVSRPSEISCIYEDGNPIGNFARENSEGYEALYTN